MITTTQTWEIGDSFEIMKQFPDNHFDLILTDPPYGIKVCKKGTVGGGGITGFDRQLGKKSVPIKCTTFGKQTWDEKRLEKKYFDEMFRVSKNQIIFGGNYYIDYLNPTSCMIVWDKDNTGTFADCEIAWTSFKTAVRLFKYRWNGMLQGNMKNKEVRVHPTQKPVPLFQWILEKYTSPTDTILDPFCGSGTILEACKNLNLECFAVDKSNEWVPHYHKRLNPNSVEISKIDNKYELTGHVDSALKHFK